MKREHFVKVVEETLDSLPQEFRSRIRNVAVLVEDVPPSQPSPHSGQGRRLLLGLFHGVPTAKKSIFDLPTGPDHMVLYHKNIEAVCSSEAVKNLEKRATMVLDLEEKVAAAVKKLKERGLVSPHLRSFVVARINPLRWIKAGASGPPDEET
jgi:predicted Zn-dependent protease with MMP-like domain